MDKPNLTAERLRELLHYDPKTGAFTWRVFRGRTAKPGDLAGSTHHHGYSVITIDGKSHGAHRLAWMYAYGAMPLEHIDHINGDRADNRLQNLRDVSRSVNKQNIKRARSDSVASGLVGAFWHKQAQKWFANIGANGVRRHLGMFDTPEAAHAAYLEAKRRLHPGCTI